MLPSSTVVIGRRKLLFIPHSQSTPDPHPHFAEKDKNTNTERTLTLTFFGGMAQTIYFWWKSQNMRCGGRGAYVEDRQYWNMYVYCIRER
jgi:hypothetical protein